MLQVNDFRLRKGIDDYTIVFCEQQPDAFRATDLFSLTVDDVKIADRIYDGVLKAIRNSHYRHTDNFEPFEVQGDNFTISVTPGSNAGLDTYDTDVTVNIWTSGDTTFDCHICGIYKSGYFSHSLHRMRREEW